MRIIEVDGKRYTVAAHEELSGYKVCTCCKTELALSSFKRIRQPEQSVGKSGKHIQMFNSICRVCESASVLRYYYKNQEEKIEYQKKRNRLMLDVYRHRKNAHGAAYRAASRSATPSWLTKEDRKHMRDLYNLREQLTNKTGTLHHVDHVIPLNGLSVCGLHVPWNLQVIPSTQNSQKSNQLDHELLQELYFGYSQTEITTELYLLLKEHNLRLKFTNTPEISESITENI